MLNWDSLQSACLSCTRCPLSQTRHHVVFGVGPQDAEVLFVGEGPGENEDLQGEPFVGAAGKFLDEMLTIIDLGRHNCYITNIIKCRPPKNRDPMQTEQDACIDFLRAQTKLLKPKIIVCLGRIAAKRLIDPDYRITRQHGQWVERNGDCLVAVRLYRHPHVRSRRQGDSRQIFPRRSGNAAHFPAAERIKNHAVPKPGYGVNVTVSPLSVTCGRT